MGKKLVKNSKMQEPNIATNEASKMRSYRFRPEAIKALQALTQAVNQRSVIKISSTNVLELLILDAAKGDVDRILSLIDSTKNK